MSARTACPHSHPAKQWYVDRAGRGRCRVCAAEYWQRKYVPKALRDPVRLALEECAKVLAEQARLHSALPCSILYGITGKCDCGKAVADVVLKQLAEVRDGK